MAKRFHFRLQPVLRYREILEEQKKKDFALANRETEEHRLAMEELVDDRGQTQEDVRALYARGSDFHNVVEAYRYINTLDLQLAREARHHQKLEAAREEKRQAFIEAQRDRKGLEILRDKRRDEHRAAEARDEQNELDELAIRAQRRRREEEAARGETD